MNSIVYMAVIESFVYAIVGTQVNLTFVMNKVSQFMIRPGLTHWMAMEHIMRYLKGI